MCSIKEAQVQAEEGKRFTQSKVSEVHDGIDGQSYFTHGIEDLFL